MKLVLAEKPSVAQSIAKVLGAAKREDGYLEGNGYVVSWCVGHLVELAQPEVYDAKYSKWAYADLPIFPMDWQYEVSAGTKKQFGILKKLMAREDVASLVCATDAGREGELIFRLVYHKAGCRKPFERLWISSMEDVAIKEGFENLRSGTEYDALYEAALCRERADWIVGINATRLFSTLYGQTLNVGRVMTPTLAMAVMREAAISAFKPELFYTVQIGLDGFTAASERFKTKAAAEAVKQSCSVAIVQKAECKEKTEKPPALYDLTSLQREANRVLGYTAQQTLDYTQNLYEKKLVTYPRTDSRFLTEDMAHSLTDLVKLAFHTFPVEDVDNIPVHAEQVVNNKKVTDHHAIIPTRELQKCNLSELPKGELAILQLISNRLCVAVGDPHRYAETVIELDCGGTVFSTKGKTVVQDGWKALVQKNDSTKSDENVQTLPSVSVGDEMTVSGTEIKEGKTSPPKHFTEDTLLSAMETAGADEMPDEVERKGLGTPATRAGIIEKLVRIGFLERKGDKKTKHLIPTHKGTALVTVMPEQIQSPSMTADWEEKLLLIEKGEYAEAKKRKLQVEYEQESGTFIPPSAKTVNDLLDEYMSIYGVNTWAMSTYESRKSLIANYIRPLIGDMKLEDVTPRIMDKYYRDLLSVKAVSSKYVKARTEYLTPHTVREVHKTLRNAFNQAVKWELMTRNPVEHATLPKEEHKTRDIWTAEVLQKALEACDDDILRLAINLAFSCSLRMGELLGLTWDCIDISPTSIELGQASIFVEKELQRVNREAMADLDGKDIMFKFPPTFASTHTALVLKTPKTKTSVRKVFLPKTVAEMLVQRKADIEELKDLFGDEFVDFNLVFCSSNGKPIEGQVINRAFNKLIEEKGLPKVVFHSLRHSSITYKLKLNGGDMKSVQGDSGHAQVKMVADVYSHIIDDDRRLNAERMEAAFYSGRQATPEPVQPAATESSADDKELLLKLLQNPEMAALLKSLAKTL